jgi:predicted ArsR family transcriptional regulator
MDALDVIGDPALRTTLLYVRRNRCSASIGEVASATGVHRNVARRRLERLSAAGLLTTGFERRSGRGGPGAGRPAKVYAPAPETAAIEFPERHYADLLGLLAEDVSPARRAATGLRFGAMLAAAANIAPAKEPRAGLERLCDAVGRLGFQARVERLAWNRAVIVTPTCPLRPLVVANRAASDLDRGMWRGLVAAAVDGLAADDVRCGAHGCLDPCAPCRVVLSFSGS